MDAAKQSSAKTNKAFKLGDLLKIVTDCAKKMLVGGDNANGYHSQEQRRYPFAETTSKTEPEPTPTPKESESPQERSKNQGGRPKSGGMSKPEEEFHKGQLADSADSDADDASADPLILNLPKDHLQRLLKIREKHAKMTKEDLEQKVKGLTEINEGFKKDLDKRDADISALTDQLEEKERYTSFGNSAILSGIVIVVLTILRSIVNCITGFIIDPWFGLLSAFLTFFGSFVMFAMLTFGLAGAYYIAGSILKEKWNYSKLLSIAAMSVGVGYIIRSVIAPFCSLIYGNFGTGISMAGLVYMILMLYEGVNDETGLTGNRKIYVHAACLGITFLISFLF